jgi:hypothetical protein
MTMAGTGWRLSVCHADSVYVLGLKRKTLKSDLAAGHLFMPAQCDENMSGHSTYGLMMCPKQWHWQRLFCADK